MSDQNMFDKAKDAASGLKDKFSGMMGQDKGKAATPEERDENVPDIHDVPEPPPQQ
jgi:hypothetical protein